jgi:hypothetical protein
VVKVEALMNELLDEVSVLATEVATYRNKIGAGKILTELPRPIRFAGETIRSDLYDLDLVTDSCP